MEFSLIVCVFLSFGGILVHGRLNLTDAEILAFKAPKEIQEAFPYYISGHDEDGAPIFIYELGKWDIRKYMEQGGEKFKALDIYFDQFMLTMREYGLNSTAGQFISFADVDKFDAKQARNLKTVSFMISKFQRFEEIIKDGVMKRGLMVNANFLWEQIWALGRPLLGSLSESIELYGTNKKDWIPRILKFIPKSQLPEWYGGSAEHKPVQVFG